MLNTIAAPFGWLLLFLHNLTHSYFFAVVLFALVVKVILLPFQMKSKRSTMRMSRLTPKMKELEKRHEGNKQKYQESVSQLYKDEKVNPMSGCLWSLLPFPIMIALYRAIRMPLSVMMGIAGDKVTEIVQFLSDSGFYNIADTIEKAVANDQISIANSVSGHFSAVLDKFPELVGKMVNIDYHFLGMSLDKIPTWRVWTIDYSDPKIWLPTLGLILFPVISALASYFSMKISSASAPAAPGQQNMKGMMLTMPAVSLVIGFGYTAALSVYWIATSVLALIQDIILKNYYTKKLDAEDSVRLEAERQREEELEYKRVETERLRLEGKLTQNKNTSKKKLQTQDRSREEDRQAKERTLKRLEQGIVDEKPDSQVGTRRFARGRAYIDDRFDGADGVEDSWENTDIEE